jgi:hypothetical protein
MKRSFRPLAISVGILGFILWWWWPGLMGQGNDHEITVVGTGEIETSRLEISRRLREEGFSLQWVTSIDTWCDFQDEIPNLISTKIVFSPSELQECSRSVQDILDDFESKGYLARFVLLDLGDWSAYSTDSDIGEQIKIGEQMLNGGARRVATERLIGIPDQDWPCVWWEDCDSSGRTVARTNQGLTPDGQDRLARLITAAVV